MDRVSSERDYVVITMRRYPRFIARELRQEYLSSMSPDRELFEEWLAAKRKYNDHNGAFRRSRFEERFTLDEQGLADLERLSTLARKRDVYLVCNCPLGERCHREMLLLLAKKLFRAKAEKPKQEYPIFTARLNCRTRLQMGKRIPKPSRKKTRAGPKTKRGEKFASRNADLGRGSAT